MGWSIWANKICKVFHKVINLKLSINIMYGIQRDATCSWYQMHYGNLSTCQRNLINDIQRIVQFYIFFYISTWWGSQFILTDGGRDDLPYPDTGCPVPDVYILNVPYMINAWILFITFIHLPWVFPPTDNIFLTTDWIKQNEPHLHQIYILNFGYSKGGGVSSCFATSSPCGVCMMVYVRVFGFQK